MCITEPKVLNSHLIIKSSNIVIEFSDFHLTKTSMDISSIWTWWSTFNAPYAAIYNRISHFCQYLLNISLFMHLWKILTVQMHYFVIQSQRCWSIFSTYALMMSWSQMMKWKVNFLFKLETNKFDWFILKIFWSHEKELC